MRSPNRFTRKGFTIVELIVIIVIIGILAAVSYITYQIFITRSQNAATLAAATQVGKLVSGQSAQVGVAPAEWTWEQMGTAITEDAAQVSADTVVIYPSNVGPYLIKGTAGTEAPVAQEGSVCVTGANGYTLQATLPVVVGDPLAWTEAAGDTCLGAPLQDRSAPVDGGFVDVASTSDLMTTTYSGATFAGTPLVYALGSKGVGVYSKSGNTITQVLAASMPMGTNTPAMAATASRIFINSAAPIGSTSYSFGSWDGAAWTAESGPCSGGSSLTHLATSSVGQVYASCNNETVMRRTGPGTWTEEVSSMYHPSNIAVGPDGTLYFVGATMSAGQWVSVPYRIQAGTISQMGSAAASPFRGSSTANRHSFAVAPNGDLYALGTTDSYQVRVSKWNATAWTDLTTNPYLGLGVQATGSNTGAAFDDSGRLYLPLVSNRGSQDFCVARWDGSVWTGVSTIPTGSQWCVANQVMNEGANMLVLGDRVADTQSTFGAGLAAF